MDKRTRTAAIGIAAIILFLLIASTWIQGDESPGAGTDLFRPIAPVVVEPFEVHVVEHATLDARQSVTLSSELPSNRAKLLYLAPEGELIQAGETVARFDPTPFEEDIQKIENELREEESNLLQAQAELRLQKADNEDDANKLQHQVEVARLKLEELREGSMPIRVARARKELNALAAKLKQASRARRTEEELFEKGLTRQQSLQAAVDREEEIAAEHRIAARNLETLENVTLPSELKQAELQLAERKNALTHFNETLQYKRQQQKAIIARTENRLRVLQQKLKRTRGHLEKTTLKAPVTGIVLYKTLSIQNEERKVQVGDSLWNRHAFAVIPDMSSMVARVEVREREIGRIAPGQAATIRPQAWPDLALSGKVESIGTLVSRSEGRENHFAVRIALHDSDPRLRPGMSARASILTSRLESATLIPVEAVFREEGESVCYLWRDGDPLRVPVTLGTSDGERIVVKEGLERGDSVMLVYPNRYSS